uniref:Lipase_3 domain-containing protein n=1 Tax=Rhabditophanes sp. KR3021 TaxID=114890 RepID=A0AC35TLS4_9BILA
MKIFSLLILLASTQVNGQYSDSVARMMLSMSAAAYSDHPEDCVATVFSKGILIRKVSAICDITNKAECTGFTAIDKDSKIIIVAFRGTNGFAQLALEAVGEIFGDPIDFISGGGVSPYFNAAFDSVWHAGLKDSFLTLKNTYPTYKVHITGHSLGGAMASLCAATIAKSGYVTNNDMITLYTYGQPRTGNTEYVAGFDSLAITDVYRVTHARDLVPHLPPGNLKGYTHHRTEVWYNDDMTAGSKFKICAGDETKKCSESLTFTTSVADHLHYFDVDVNDFGLAGCKQ